MRQERPKVDQRSLHVMSLFAVVMALIVSVLPPAIIFYQGAQFQKGALTSSVHLKAIHVSALIGRNPEFWKFEGIRISDILMEASNGETYVVKLLDGELIEKNGPDVQANPQTEVSAPLFDSGVQIASITAKKSLFPVLIQSIILALLTFSLGALSYIALKTIPIRLIHRAINNAAFLASHDPLTQLPNRALFGDWLAKSIQQASQKNTTIAVLSLDLDRFKEVNDLFGHAIGDALLIQVTRRIEAIVKKTAFIARVGGDEFCIVQSLQPQPSGAACLSERLIAALSQPFKIEQHEIDIGISIGISISDKDTSAVNASLLLQQSDLALYDVKADGRGAYRFFADEMNEKFQRRRWLEQELKQALKRGELELHYQPQIDLAQSATIGVEALCRWHHPKEGWISPDIFIPIAEENGLILEIGNWIINEACRQSKEWPLLKFAVNVSPIQILKSGLVKTIQDAMTLHQIDPERLEIEITERVLLHNTEETVQVLTEIQSLGIRVAMDDFGTGYSSLSYFQKFSFDKVKIDQSFISKIHCGKNAEIIIEAVINLGLSLGMSSNAEGVETFQQAEWLREIGCKEVQGYYFAKPMPSKEILQFLERELLENAPNRMFTKVRSA